MDSTVPSGYLGLPSGVSFLLGGPPLRVENGSLFPAVADGAVRNVSSPIALVYRFLGV